MYVYFCMYEVTVTVLMLADCMRKAVIFYMPVG